MLNMGFVDDVEKILSSANNVQTLLFSATLPSWVKQVTTKFLKPDHKVVDNVGESKMKANAAIKHMVLPCHWSQNNAMVEDLVRCYGGGKTGRTIVFVERKASADEMASAIGESTGARALHGDVPQATREVTLSAFRNGKFNVLVATDVAARGLDISGIELVIQSEPPKDAET